MRPPQDWRAAPLSLAFAAAITLAWLLAVVLGLQDDAAIVGGFIPARVGGVAGDTLPIPVWLTPLTATLVHSGFVHLIFNVLILLFCGRATETILGRQGFVILYVAGAFAAAAAHWAVFPLEIAPMIGASGAISALLGAYALTFGRNKIKVASPRLAVFLHALWLGAAWIVLQLLIGFTFTGPGERIAFAAHIGGFLAGLLLAKPLLLLRWRGA